jgi:glycosyltransferase involved in cell wall biosynthesis
MRVLMIAPHPVYSARGTPISVHNRCVALGRLGHQVDLVTYPVGTDRPAPGLRYVRPGRRFLADWEVPIGMSRPKLVLNVLVAARATALAARHGRDYDVVHSHEEGSLVGLPLARALGLPHVYDMGNEWGTVVDNFGRSGGALSRLAGRVERWVLDRSAVTIVQLPATFERLSRTSPDTALQLIPNVPLDPVETPAAPRSPLAQLGIGAGSPVVAYVGSLERYQGIEILIDAMAEVVAALPTAVLVVGGGRPSQVDQLRARAAGQAVDGHIHFLGEVAPEAADALLATADVLVSPRASGDNTPLKLFSYLRAGRPIVATDILSHTQVLSADHARLVAAEPHSMAGGIIDVLGSPAVAQTLAAGAAALADRYSPESFYAATNAAYDRATSATRRRRAVEPLIDHQQHGAVRHGQSIMEKGAVG